MVTVVITSCGRLDLLKRTIHSFNRFNSFPISHMLVIDDSGEEEKQSDIWGYLNDLAFSQRYGVRMITNVENIGQVRSIDKVYGEVTTPYIFHCEEDWEFYRHGFIEKSLDVLEWDKKIITVWLRERGDTNGHPIEEDHLYQARNTQYNLVEKDFQEIWHGFTWNPGLRRKSDYDRIKPFVKYGGGEEASVAECLVGQEYEKLGYRGAILTEGYVKHIGYGESTRG